MISPGKSCSPCHLDLEKPLFGCLPAEDLAHDGARAQHQDAIGHVPDFLKVCRANEDGGSSITQAPEFGVDLELRRDVDSCGWFVENQHGAGGTHPSADHHLLLIAARKGTDADVDGGRAYIGAWN